MPFNEQELQALEQLMARPKARSKVQEIFHAEFPDVVIPEVEAKNEIRLEFQEALKNRDKQIEELTVAVQNQRVEKEWREQEEKIRKSLGWDDKRMGEFKKAFAEEFKDKKSMDMLDMAEYFDLKNRPLTPQAGTIGPFGVRRSTSSAEAKWRQDKDDPKSPMFSRNRKEKKKYFRELWKQAREEMVAEGIR